MSYCRFSSNNFWCDVYVYEDVYGGWTTHVAGYRHIIRPIPLLPSWWITCLGRYDIDAKRVLYPNRFIAAFAWVWLRIYFTFMRLHNWSVGVIPRRKIGLPHDGARFNDATAKDCADRLIYLHDLGYKVPRSAVNALLVEDLP